MDFSLAWRNVWRNKRRTLITCAAIAFSCAVLVFFNALQLSSYEAAIEATTSIMQGHLQIQKDGYLDKAQIRNDIHNISGLSQKLSLVEGVTGVAARAYGFALVSSENRSFGVQVVGVNPEQEQYLSTIPKQIRNGHYLEPSSHQAVIGAALAKNLKIEQGQEITLLGQAQEGSLAVGVFTVVGIFESGSPELDRLMLQIPLDTFQDVFSMRAQSGHVLAIRGKSVESAQELKNKISDSLSKQNSKELRIHTWEELSPGLKEMIELDMASGWLFFSSLILIVVFSVLNTFAMSLFERTKEFGVLLALGANRARITGIVFFELLLLLAIGLMPGIALGCSVVWYFQQVGFSVPGSEEIMKLWNLPVAIYPNISLIPIILGPSFILLGSLLAVFLPMIRLWKLKPVEAMRSV